MSLALCTAMPTVAFAEMEQTTMTESDTEENENPENGKDSASAEDHESGEDVENGEGSGNEGDFENAESPEEYEMLVDLIVSMVSEEDFGENTEPMKTKIKEKALAVSSTPELLSALLGDYGNEVEALNPETEALINVFCTACATPDFYLETLKVYYKMIAINLADVESVEKIDTLETVEVLREYIKTTFPEDKGEDSESPEVPENPDPTETPENPDTGDEEALKTAIEAAIAQIKAMDYSNLTGGRKTEFEQYLMTKEAELLSCKNVEAVNKILDDVKSKWDELSDKEALEKERKKAFDTLEQYWNTLSFEVPELKTYAEDVYNTAKKMLEKAEDSDSIHKICNEALKDLANISNGNEETVKRLKEEIQKKMDADKSSILADSQIKEDIYGILKKELDNAQTVEAVITVKTISGKVFSDLKSALDEKSASAAAAVIVDLKAVATEETDNGLFDYLASKIMENKENAVSYIEEAVYSIQTPGDGTYKEHIAEKIDSAAEKFSGMATAEEADKLKALFLDKLEAAQTRKDMYICGETALKEFKELESQDSLYEKKAAAEKELDSLKENIGDKLLLEKVEEIIETAKNELKSVDTEEKIQKVVAEARKQVDALKEENEAQKDFEDKKNAMKEKLDALISTNDKDLRDILSGIINAAKTDVDLCKDETALNEIYKKAVQDVKTATEDYTKDKALAAKKTAYIEKLSQLLNGDVNAECQSIIANAKNSIMNAESADEITQIYKEAMSAFKEANLSGLRKKYQERLDTLYDSVSWTAENQAKADEIISRAKDNINSASSEEVMKQIYTQAEEAIHSLSFEKNNLDDIKKAAIQELVNTATVDNANTQKVIATYSNKIQSATTEEQVQAYLEEGKSLLQKLNAVGENPTTEEEAKKQAELLAAEAKEKGTDQVNTVKTGDENGWKIAKNVGICLIGFGAIGYFIYLQIKKRKK